jgi:hypothetical protein
LTRHYRQLALQLNERFVEGPNFWILIFQMVKYPMYVKDDVFITLSIIVGDVIVIVRFVDQNI